MNTIDFNSSFTSFRTPKDMNEFSTQLTVARKLAQGWKQNGPMRNPKFLIVQFQPNREGKFDLVHEEYV